MMRSLWTSATGMIAMQTQIDTLSNNLANVSTTGFKKSRAEFEDLMYQTLQIAGTENADGTRTPVGMQIGMGVRPVSVHKFFTQGDFQNTGNPLDMAIEGEGFFQVIMNGETVYTRDGSFELDDQGRVVTAGGHALQPEFTVPPETAGVSISETGTIAALDKDGTVLAQANIDLYRFQNPAGLIATGRNFYRESEASGAAVAGTPGDENFGTIAQGFLEGSNVEMVDEMVGLIVGQRAFEINSKAITTSDAMLQTAINIKR
ncbi:flagellar basal-body rod protein FlgG [Pseudodesulfovibrio indicus]|uniref:Flagellar basal-body rod protein FlgG n=1 Tax=Pseudodesulfovibrio indicus TaxID=1716143 RepID=A0A126QRP4_9BACT|nr:flagellar basal-body rod protein FlgG [Pseudodesulfovibrio indicus]AMK12155.1 flagellar basal-body rod protein FlgG [Pseudodesulfovibrio indicus]TDT88760.1 flagellar basal-body rod protein FlgG [Pseudodesulfovibrio indicus]